MFKMTFSFKLDVATIMAQQGGLSFSWYSKIVIGDRKFIWHWLPSLKKFSV